MTARRINNHWYVDVHITLPDGARMRVRKKSPFPTKRETIAYERDLVDNIISSSSKKRSTERRFPEFAVEFLSRYVDVHLKYSTKVTYRSAIEVHIEPYFADHFLSEIDAAEIAGFQAHMGGQGARSPKTVRNIVAVLTRALRTAVEWGELAEMPAVTRVKVPRTREARFLTVPECDQLELGATPYWLAMIRVARKTGLRMGELCALTWGQVDLDRHRLHVDRAVWRGKVSLPKHDRIRDVSLSAQTVGVFRGLEGGAGDKLVFSTARGTMRKERTADRGLRRCATRAGLEPFGWHVMRHTFASHLAMANVPMRAIQDLMGHADIQTTMRYAHLTPRALDLAVNVLDEAPVAENFGHPLGIGGPMGQSDED